MGAIFMSENSTSGIRTRHIDTQYHFVCELVEGKIVEIIFVKTEDSLADGFTKNMNGEIYEAHTPDYVIAKEDLALFAVDVTATKGVLEICYSSAVSESPAFKSHNSLDWIPYLPESLPILLGLIS